MANPNKVPLAILRARGSKNACRIGRHEPAVIEGNPDPPEWLLEAAKPYFEEILELAPPHVMSKTDGLHVVMLAEAFADYARAKQMIQEHGELDTAKSGALYPHPAVGMKNKAHARVVAGLSKLGMNPSDRSNVAAAPEAKKGKVGKFLGIA